MTNRRQAAFIFGIDPGEHTGFAIYDVAERRFRELRTFHHDRYKWTGMHRLLRFIESVIPSEYLPDEVSILIEHPGRFLYRRTVSNGRALGGDRHILNIGGVRREAELIYGYLAYMRQLPFVQLVPPVNEPKWTAAEAQRWTGRRDVSQHARDAARLCLYNIRGI
ncbi:MAG: hypothetical protein C4287_23225 [Leptolyngbya sp. ERB_1_2]